MSAQSHEAEVAVVGALLMGGGMVPAVIDTGLLAEHFYSEADGDAYRAILALHDEGKGVDPLLLGQALGISTGMVEGRYFPVVSLGNAARYATTIVDLARWRQRLAAGREIQRAAETQDEQLFAVAEASLLAPSRRESVFDKQRLRALLLDRIEGQPVERFPLPFSALSRLLAGGLRRGGVTLIGGWTSHGKTVFLDQVSTYVAEHSAARVWAWINEMSPEERGTRMLAQMADLPLERIEASELNEKEKARAIYALDHLPFEIVACPGWSVEAITRDIRVRTPDLACVDILHKIPHRETADLAHISRALGDCAKIADCHILVTVHLNRGRIVTAARPQPTLADLKGASALEQDADNVIFVWREDDAETGLPTNVGQIYVAKARQGRPGGIAVTFDGTHARFDEAPTWS